ncbi:MAG: hypothetical protein GXO77_03115 [Calditrichaeota bacterium]|nr:hypothetical protein [Calditrichota bacterium]
MKFPGIVLLPLLVLSYFMPGLSQTRLGGFVEYDNITYLKNGSREKINGRNQAILQLELRHQVNSKADIFGSVEIRNDQADPSRNRIYLDEAYINLYLGDFDIRVGKQIYAWGRADGFNPTDNLTAWDFSDILDTEDEKIGVVSARVNYYFGDWSMEAVLEPSFTASVLPDGAASRWWLKMPPVVPNPAYPQAGLPTLKAAYVIAPPVLPDQGVRSTQYALKLSGTARGWDFSVSWFDGFDDLPSIHTATVVDSAFTSALITLQPKYHRRRAIGADFATAFNRLGVRGEAAYYLTEDWNGVDPDVDDPYLQYVLGLDYTFRDVLPGKDLFILLQWVQEVQTPNRNTVYRETDLNHLFRKSIIGKADLSLGDFTKLTVEGVGNLATDDWWIRPGLEWAATDGVKLLITADLLGGVDNSFFGSFRDNRRLQFRLKYSF